MTEMVTSGSMSGRWKRGYGSLGEGLARKRGPALGAADPTAYAPPLDSTGRIAVQALGNGNSSFSGQRARRALPLLVTLPPRLPVALHVTVVGTLGGGRRIRSGIGEAPVRNLREGHRIELGDAIQPCCLHGGRAPAPRPDLP